MVYAGEKGNSAREHSKEAFHLKFLIYIVHED